MAAVAVVAVALVAVAGGCGGGKADEVRFQNASEPGPKPFTEPTDVPKGSSTASTPTTSSSSSSGSSSSGGSSSAGSGSSGSGSSGSGSSNSGSGSGSSDSGSGSSGSGSSDSGASGAGASSGASGAASGEEQKRGAFTERNTVCDREKLISALAADEGKLKAWAEAAGVDADQQAVAEYIRELKPSTLTRDTQVTTHSYENGEATEYQAILTKGTAVLVDDSGKPVARCVCGNPLSEPAELEQTTKCVNCPPDYQPSDSGQGGPCEEKCARPEPNPPPTLPPTAPPAKPNTNPVDVAKAELDKCKRDKGGLKNCEKEYEATRELCARNPINKACDSSVCFDAALDVSKNACPSYIDGELGACLGKENNDAKNACLKQVRDLKAKCIADPTQADCKLDLPTKGVKLRQKCGSEPARPECVAVQLDCLRNPGQFRCEGLRNACQAGPDRPDCKGAQQFRLSCLKTPELPECKGVTPPTAAGQNPDQTGEQQGEQGTDTGTGTGDTGTGTGSGDTGTGDGAGQTPGGETPQPETPQEQPGGE
jgi:hypothetical protein